MVSVGDPSDRLRLVNLTRQKVHEQNRQKIKHNGMGRFFALQDLQEHTKTPSEVSLRVGSQTMSDRYEPDCLH